MSKPEVVEQAFQAETEDRNKLVAQFGEQVCPWKPNRESGREASDFAEIHGSSEELYRLKEANQCVKGCRCYRHREIENCLNNRWQEANVNYLEPDRKDPRVSRIVDLVARDWRGRKPMKVYGCEKHTVSDYWDSGSKNTAYVVGFSPTRPGNLADVGFVRQVMGNPFNQNVGECTLGSDFAIVERVCFCGKDLGVRIYVHPDNLELFGG